MAKEKQPHAMRGVTLKHIECSNCGRDDLPLRVNVNGIVYYNCQRRFDGGGWCGNRRNFGGSESATFISDFMERDLNGDASKSPEETSGETIPSEETGPASAGSDGGSRGGNSLPDISATKPIKRTRIFAWLD